MYVPQAAGFAVRGSDSGVVKLVQVAVPKYSANRAEEAADLFRTWCQLHMLARLVSRKCSKAIATTRSRSAYLSDVEALS